eukprot:3232407-Prymnesium_polylepis.1
MSGVELDASGDASGVLLIVQLVAYFGHRRGALWNADENLGVLASDTIVVHVGVPQLQLQPRERKGHLGLFEVPLSFQADDATVRTRKTMLRR